VTATNALPLSQTACPACSALGKAFYATMTPAEEGAPRVPGTVTAACSCSSCGYRWIRSQWLTTAVVLVSRPGPVVVVGDGMNLRREDATKPSEWLWLAASIARIGAVK